MKSELPYHSRHRRAAEARDAEVAELDPIVCYRALQTRDARFDHGSHREAARTSWDRISDCSTHAMQALREPDVFAVKEIRELQKIAEACRPWRAYAAMRLQMQEESLYKSKNPA